MSRAWHAGPALSTGRPRATGALRQDHGVESQPLPRRRKPRRRLSRAQRTRAALAIAELHDGVAHRADLRTVGVTRADVRTEIGADRWMTAGKHTVVIGSGTLTTAARHWQAVWESGSGAVLDGAAALVASGLSGFTPTRIDVSLPRNNRRHTVPGVVRHLRSTMPPALAVGIPRVKPEWATIHAAQWAVSDRQAALLLCLPVQQRLVLPERVLQAWRASSHGPRHALLDVLVRDVCDGAHSLGELDFAGMCRERGLPEPSRQEVRRLPSGRVYLDTGWDDLALVVEIDGGHHALALNPVDDALRQNDVVLSGHRVLRIPVLGLRLKPRAFMDQVVRAHQQARAAAA